MNYHVPGRTRELFIFCMNAHMCVCVCMNLDKWKSGHVSCMYANTCFHAPSGFGIDRPFDPERLLRTDMPAQTCLQLLYTNMFRDLDLKDKARWCHPGFGMGEGGRPTPTVSSPRYRARSERLARFMEVYLNKLLKPRPDFGHDCLICPELARQRLVFSHAIRGARLGGVGS